MSTHHDLARKVPLALGSVSAMYAIAPSAASAETSQSDSVSTAGPQSPPANPFEITQDVTVNKARTADKAYRAMDVYIRD